MHYLNVKVFITQSCLTLCDAMDYSLTGSSVHGILQERILKLVAMPFSRGIFQIQGSTEGSRITCRFFTIWATKEAPMCDFVPTKHLKSIENCYKLNWAVFSSPQNTDTYIFSDIHQVLCTLVDSTSYEATPHLYLVLELSIQFQITRLLLLHNCSQAETVPTPFSTGNASIIFIAVIYASLNHLTWV